KRIEDGDVFLRADADVPYGDVMEVMAEIKKAGVKKLGLVTEPLSSNSSQTRQKK
ncbi:MAG TPA: biopolymer transporter ExbD, partial [Thermodesulfobacteriota bacterium]|nr:biopolymer transporter ExbD [Thermodesulfobacteriota bacterium]